MYALRFVAQVISVGVRFAFKVNGMVAAHDASGASFASTRSLKPLFIAGENTLEIEAELAERPPDDQPYTLELVIHAAPEQSELSDVTEMLSYALTDNELPAGNGPFSIYRYPLRLGNDDTEADRPWSKGRVIEPALASQVMSGGLQRCKSVLETRDPARVTELLALAGADSEDVLQILSEPDVAVDVPHDVRPVLLHGGRVAQANGSGLGPSIVIRSRSRTLGFIPAFSVINDQPHVVGWA